MYLLGDIHGETPGLYRWLFNSDEKYCVQLGDFGFIFEETPVSSEARVLDMLEEDLEEQNKTLFTILGNHECWPRYMEMEEATAYGAKCWLVRPRILAVQKGQILSIEDKNFLCIGGANSHDVEWRTKYARTYGVNIWWPEEQIEEEDIEVALENCEGKKIDYVLSHTPPATITYKLFENPFFSQSEVLIDKIYNDLKFTHWYCGHAHLHYESEYCGKNLTVLDIDEGIAI